VNDTDGQGVKSAERALTILELFSRPGRALTFTQVAEQLGYPRSSLHGLLRTLTDRGWLRLDPATRRFSLGLRAWQTGSAYRPAVELERTARQVVDKLQQAVEGDVHVVVLDDGDAVSLISTDEEVLTAERFVAHRSACGQVLLAHLEPERVTEMVAPHLGGDVDKLHETLEQVRDQGFAEGYSTQGDGRFALAVPLRNELGEVVASLAMTAEPSRLQGGGRERALEALRRAAASLAPSLAPVPA
jgi:DNA-binding IclR family transcriptional regulator